MAELENRTRPHLYLGTRKGLFGALLTGGEAEVFPVALWNTTVVSVAVSEAGQLRALGTRDTGLQSVQADGSTAPVTALAKATVTTLINDISSGTSYAGTSPAKLWRSNADGPDWSELQSFNGPWLSDWRNASGSEPWVSCLMSIQGALFVGIHAGGVIRTADAGRTFEVLSEGLPPGVRALSGRSDRPNVIYAGTDVGLFVSEKGGYEWHRVDHDDKRLAVTCVAVNPQDPSVVLVGSARSTTEAKPAVPAGADARLHRSSDAGQSFEELGTGSLPLIRGVFTGFVFHPKDAAVAFASTSTGELFASEDGGAQWRVAATTLPGILDLAPGPGLFS